MEVTKRGGACEPVRFDKIVERLSTLTSITPPISIDLPKIVISIMNQFHDKISTSKIDELSAQACAAKCTEHPDFGTLAGRIVVSNNHKNTSASLVDVVTRLYQAKRVNSTYYGIVCAYSEELQTMLDFSRDYVIDYFGFKTLERAYLLKCDDEIVERPQHMWMRVAICIHGDCMEKVKETYDLMSQKYFTHATPTLFNAGTAVEQLSSCFFSRDAGRFH